jgi:hypothetical protein
VIDGGEQTRALARLLAIALCAGAFLFIVIAIVGGDEGESGKTFGTAFALLLFGLSGGAGAGLVRRRPHLALLGILTVIASLLAFGGITALFWSSAGFGSDTSVQVAGVTGLLAIAMGFSSQLLGSVRDGDEQGVRLARGGAIAALAVLIGMLVVDVVGDSDTIGARPIAVCAVFFILGTALTPLLRMIEAPGR